MHDYTKESFKMKVILDSTTDNTIVVTITLDEYLKVMWQLKTRAFITIWNHTINKMHIVCINTPISRTMNLLINDFIHEQKTDVTLDWEFRRDVFLSMNRLKEKKDLIKE